MKNSNKLIPLDTKLKNGVVSAIKLIEGERYYFLIDKEDSISMLPASLIESKEYLEGYYERY